MYSPELKLDYVLRRALGRAGVVTGFIHKCRRHHCGYEIKASTDECGRCPKCRMRLYPKLIPRKVRFHDLRHTTATLLLKEGVPLATVQRVLRHTDPRLTTEIYGHLDVEDMRWARSPPHRDVERATAPGDRGGGGFQERHPDFSSKWCAGGAGRRVIGKNDPGRVLKIQQTPGLGLVGETGFEPATPWSRTGARGIPQRVFGWYAIAINGNDRQCAGSRFGCRGTKRIR